MKYLISENRMEELLDKYLTDGLFNDLEHKTKQIVTQRRWVTSSGAGMTMIPGPGLRDPHTDKLFIDCKIVRKIMDMFNLSLEEAENVIKNWIQKNYEVKINSVESCDN